IAKQLAGLTGPQVAQTIQSAIEATEKARGTGIWAGLISIVLVFAGATGVFSELKYAINAIWGEPDRTKAPVLVIIKTQLLSISLILCIGFLLLISLVISSVLAALSHYFLQIFPMGIMLGKFADLLLSFFIVSALFAAIFKIMVNVPVRWKEAFLGGMLTSILFTIGKAIIAWYIGRVGVASSFGAAGSLVILLLWVYYTSCILFYGAEFTKLYQKRSSKSVDLMA
ncbi:MAG: YihY/virulence factor BrkB family protein, partial [Chthoniobacterales bacterium]